MKWFLLLLSVFAILPLAGWLSRSSRHMQIALVAMGFLPFCLATIPQLDVALIDWAGWPGYTKGILFSALDALALSMLLASRRESGPLALRGVMVCYLIAVLIASANARQFEPSVFYIWQLLRISLLYFVIVRTVRTLDDVQLVLIGFGLGLCLQLVLVIYQRFELGDINASGSFSHRNQLGLVSNLVMMPLFGLWIVRRSKMCGVVAVAGLLTAALTTSRATIGLAIAGCSLIMLVALLLRPGGRILKLAFLGMILVGAAAPFTLSGLEQRFAGTESSGSYDERAAFKRAAWYMSKDNPLGVGPNNFVTRANTGGYYDQAGVVARKESRSTMVHNVYFLSLAEIGYFGLLATLGLLFRPFQLSLFYGWKFRDEEGGFLLLCIAISLLCLYIHSWYEWILFTYITQAIFSIILAIVTIILRYHVGLSNQNLDK